MHLILAYILALFLQVPVPPRPVPPEVKFFGDCDGIKAGAIFEPAKFQHEILYLSPSGEVMFWTFGTEVCLTDIQLPKEMQ